MTTVQPHHIDCSISPLRRHDAALPSGSSAQKELGKVEKQDGHINPVPDIPEVEEDIRQPRVGRRPMAPTKAEVEEHLPLHLKYRSWCEHCWSGKGRQAPHIIEPHDRDKLGITLSADYAFLTPEDKEEHTKPSLVMYHDDKDAFWAIGVERKGASEPIVKYVKGYLTCQGTRARRSLSRRTRSPRSSP